jgi:tRNA pseudouridine55 synthase
MGEFEQIPPRHSAKKIAGERAYEIARRAEPVMLKPVVVTVRALECLAQRPDQVDVLVTATAGFYVRALARDLGDRLGCGAHLLALRRTGSAPFDVASAVTLDEAERLGRDVVGRVLAPAEALPHLPAVTLTPVGLTRARHGNSLGPEHLEERWLPPASQSGPVRVVDADGRLIALAHSRGGALHPAVVLG